MKCGALLFSLLTSFGLVHADSDSCCFWNQQRRGANCFNEVVTLEWFAAAKSAGIEFVRLVPNKWKSQHSDFLVGDAGDYRGLVEEDLAKLIDVLDLANKHDIRIVLSTLTLPGARWRQQNGDEFDTRLWTDTSYWTRSIAFWKELARELKGHPAIIAYNLLNEPIPEKAAGFDPARGEYSKWYETVRNTAADLNRFNRDLVAAIRETDSTTPIVVDAGWWAGPMAFEYLEPLPDTNVLYSFHMYDPWEYTNRRANDGRFVYPGSRNESPCRLNGRVDTVLGRPLLECMLDPIVKWQLKHGIPSTRILVGEFGCHRMNKGAAQYLSDLIDIFDEHGWHWAFYSFREDTWDGMDYEIGDGPLGWEYWKARERGENPEPQRGPNAIWQVIERQLRDST